MSSNRSTLEILPDEMLLEVCEYLLCVDILQAFFGLNSRMRRMITQYYQHVSLHKAVITQSSYLCKNVLPQIGFHIRSLLIDRCYSVLQHDLFIKYFGKKMSIIFPHLKKISLIAYRYEHLLAFLDTLHNLNNLVEIRLYSLFEIDKDHQSIVLQALLQSNNNQLTTIFIDDESSCFSFNDIDCYVNIVQLRIKMKELGELPSLFAAIPNIRCLDVILEDDDSKYFSFDGIQMFSLHYLTEFRLKSTRRWWKLEEMWTMLDNLPNVQILSLFLCTNDSRLVCGNILLPVLLPNVQQFNYAIYYYPGLEFAQRDVVVDSWPSSHPIACFSGDSFWFIHTVPWNFDRMPILSSFGKTISSQLNQKADYDKRVKYLEIDSNKNFTLVKSLPIIAQCSRIRTLNIWVSKDGDTEQEEQKPPVCLLKLSRLNHIQFFPSSTVNVDDLSPIIMAAPNLLRLDLPFDCLMHLLENQQTCHLLGQKIMSLVIYKPTDSSEITLNEEHMNLIATSLTRLRDLYVDLKHLPPSTTTTTSNEIMPLSIESMIICLLSKFKQHKLISICIDIQLFKKMKADAKQWLQENTILGEQQFDADFHAELQRLIIWM